MPTVAPLRTTYTPCAANARAQPVRRRTGREGGGEASAENPPKHLSAREERRQHGEGPAGPPPLEDQRETPPPYRTEAKAPMQATPVGGEARRTGHTDATDLGFWEA